MISQTLNMLRQKVDRPMVAKPFSSLSAHKSIKHVRYALFTGYLREAMPSLTEK